MGLFDRIPANFKPGNLFQLGRGSKLVPAGAGATNGSILQYNSTAGWVSSLTSALDGDMLYFYSDLWRRLAAPASTNYVLASGQIAVGVIGPQWVVKIAPSAIGLTTNGDIVTQASGVLDRIAVGAASTVLRGGTAPTYGTIDNSYIDNRTRRIPCFLYDFTNGIAVPQSDAHGSLGGLPHWHLPDAATTYLFPVSAVPMPTDYVVGTVNLRWAWSSTAAGNNVRFDRQAYTEADAGTVVGTMLSAQATVAAAAAANTMTYTTAALSSNPAVDTIILPLIGRIGADAADSNTGTVCIYSIWLEYTADM